MRVTVAWALPDEQVVVPLDLPEGATAAGAIRASGLTARFPEIDLARHGVGVFGRVVSLGQVLREGDRVEIYRPLQMDPREARRRLAATGRSMGRQGGPGRRE
jgi:uncharacterized protein